MHKGIFKTLFSRMLASYLTVILCLLLLMGITVSSMFRTQYLQEEEDVLKKETAKINAILEEKYVFEEKMPAAMEELLIIARKYDALIQIIDNKGSSISFYDHMASKTNWEALAEYSKRAQDEDGKIRVSLVGIDIWPEAVKPTFRRLDGSQKFWIFNPVQPLSENGVIIYDLFSKQADIPTLTLIRVFSNGGKPDGVILMHLDLSTINATIRQVYLDVLLIGLVAVAAAVLTVYYLTTRITKPITEMNSIVKRYAKGELDLKLNDQGADEVAQLAKSFNSMADALNNLERSRKSFVANVSHELRSPLTSIMGFLKAIQDGTIPKDKSAEYLDIVVSETNRMTNMVNHLLDLARIESGQTEMRISIFDINELIRRMVLTFEARINAKSLDIALELLDPHCYVKADADQIGQVLRNLIDNAIKFSPTCGRLLIQNTVLDRQTVSVCVQDEGEGIPREDLLHVFERFYKAEKAHTPSAQSGTGLGLSIARVIMRQHGQDIYVESKPNEGTRFIFTLCRAQEARRRNEIRGEERPVKRDGAKEKEE